MLPLELRRCYAVLEVPLSATSQEVRASHRQLVFLWHPDRNNCRPQCEEKIREINAALSEVEAYFRAPREYISQLQRQARARSQGRRMRSRWDEKCGRTLPSKLRRLGHNFLDATDVVLNPLEDIVYGTVSCVTRSGSVHSSLLGAVLIICTLGTMGTPAVFTSFIERDYLSAQLAQIDTHAAAQRLSRDLALMGSDINRAVSKCKRSIKLTFSRLQ